MLDKSIAAMISAIEIYNKPDFKYREESFIVLAVNAWELLFKAQILSESKNKLNSLYVYHDNGRIKRTRTNNPMTIELVGSMRILKVDQAIVDNIISLVEIRDTAIHFFHRTDIKYIVFALGVATLQNYHDIVKEWFGAKFLNYDFYIMPLAFMYDFTNIKTLDSDKTPPVVANIIKSVTDMKNSVSDSSNYRFVCEIKAELFSAKKSTKDADVVVKIDQSAPDAKVAITTYSSKLEQYPLTYREVIQKVKEALPGIKQGMIDEVMKTHGVKADRTYSAYSFRNKTQDTEYQKTGVVPAGITVIYNNSAVNFIISKLK